VHFPEEKALFIDQLQNLLLNKVKNHRTGKIGKLEMNEIWIWRTWLEPVRVAVRLGY